MDRARGINPEDDNDLTQHNSVNEAAKRIPPDHWNPWREVRRDRMPTSGDCVAIGVVLIYHLPASLHDNQRRGGVRCDVLISGSLR